MKSLRCVVIILLGLWGFTMALLIAQDNWVLAAAFVLALFYVVAAIIDSGGEDAH